jgi:hypothetical protein
VFFGGTLCQLNRVNCVLLVNGVTDWTLRCTRGEGFHLGLCQGTS